MRTFYRNFKYILILALWPMVFASCSDEPVPTAGFQFEADYLSLSFTNTSKNASSYEWDFGDGNTSTEENPSHTYEEPGAYTVVLKAMNEEVDTVRANIFVQEYIDPADLRTIVFITDDNKDDDQIEWLEMQGFIVNTYYNSSLNTAPQEDIDMLNAADLVIIGRSGSSSDFEGEDKVAWNGLTVPLILNTQWAARDNRLNWFSNDGNPVVFAPGELDVVNARVMRPDDVAFEGVTIGEDNLLPWLKTPVNLLYVDAATNGEILAVGAPIEAESEEGGAILFVRFDAGTDFYEGAGEAPAGPRVYFGFGADEGGTSYYWQLTDEAKQVYLNEINRLVEPAE